MRKTIRRGMGKGMGKGYPNLIPKDPKVHSYSSRGIKQPQTKVIPLYRVLYGNKGTPIHLREYQLARGMPVGTIKEYEDIFKDDNVRLETGMSLKEKKLITKKLKLRDTDKDGVADILDCEPLNPKKQDDVPVMDIDAFVENIEKKSAPKKEEIVVPEKITRPEELDVVRQSQRVKELERQITNVGDEIAEDTLFEELKTEQKQLRDKQEKVTEIGMKDLSEQQLKNFAIRETEDSWLFPKKNKYEKELLRRINAKKKIDADIKKAIQSPVKKSVFEEFIGTFKRGK